MMAITERSTVQATWLDRPGLARIATVAAFAAIIATIAAYAGLIPLGQWQGDEYGNFERIRTNGIVHTIARISMWSPRPLSEFLIYLYASMVNAVGSPLIAPFLAGLWLVLVAACVLPVAGCSAIRGKPYALLLLPFAMIALFLSGHRVSELFYWPMGTVAYLPTLSGISFLILAVALGQGSSLGSRLAGAIALIVAALSSELGALFVAIYCLGMIALLPASSLLPRWRPLRAGDLVYCIPPLLVALFVIRSLFMGRVDLTSTSEVFGDARIAHHFVPSLLASLRSFPLELVSLGSGEVRIRFILLGLISKGAFAVGCYCVFLQLPRTRDLPTALKLGVLMIAALAAAFLSLFGGYYQFGMMCCERHETMRECFALLAILAAVALVVRLAPARLPKPATHAAALLAALSFTISVLVANTYGFSRLATEYSNYGLIIEADRRTWESGRAPGRAMVFSLPPIAVVGQAGTWPPGTFLRRDPATNFRISLVLDFFGKDEISFVEMREPPAQASQPR